MGYQADRLINGVDCEICGYTFMEEQGYPAVCGKCWSTMSKQEHTEYTKAWSK